MPPTDDSSLSCLTFRTWSIGLLSCILLSFVNQFFGFRQNNLNISPVTIQIISLPLRRLMASILPTRVFHMPFVNWSFSLNPGPFNLKEHVLITRQLWLCWCLCSRYHNHCQGLLQQANSPARSLVISSNYTGMKSEQIPLVPCFTEVHSYSIVNCL